ncbi:hypothetical protein GCM10010228_09890 [Streptomyces massasporeus]|nr:hypothetical protein GCM10010228_09890 [Streptomyces massasporeus]
MGRHPRSRLPDATAHGRLTRRPGWHPGLDAGAGTVDHQWAVASNPAGGFTLVNPLTGDCVQIPGASTTGPMGQPELCLGW